MKSFYEKLSRKIDTHTCNARNKVPAGQCRDRKTFTGTVRGQNKENIMNFYEITCTFHEK